MFTFCITSHFSSDFKNKNFHCFYLIPPFFGAGQRYHHFYKTRVSIFMVFSDRRVLIFPKAPDIPIFSWHFDVPSIIYGLQQVLRMITSHSWISHAGLKIEGGYTKRISIYPKKVLKKYFLLSYFCLLSNKWLILIQYNYFEFLNTIKTLLFIQYGLLSAQRVVTYT